MLGRLADRFRTTATVDVTADAFRFSSSRGEVTLASAVRVDARGRICRRGLAGVAGGAIALRPRVVLHLAPEVRSRADAIARALLRSGAATVKLGEELS